LIGHGEFVRPCILSNFSNGGARITGVRAETFPDEFMLRLTPHGRIHKCRVLWRTDDAVGVRFTDRETSTTTPIVVGSVQEPTRHPDPARGRRVAGRERGAIAGAA
jgi:hypothetical protein